MQKGFVRKFFAGLNFLYSFISTKFAFLFFLVLAIYSLYLYNKPANNHYHYISKTAINITAPATESFANFFYGISHSLSFLTDFINLREENIKLKEKNIFLEYQLKLFQHLSSENNELKKLLNFVGGEENHKFSTRIISTSNNNIADSFIITAGEKQGVVKGQIIVNNEGIVGRIIDVGTNASRGLLITDINSRIPVVTTTGRVKAIVAGNNTKKLDLLYITDQNLIKESDFVITSSDGNLLPYNLPVGIIRKDEAGKFFVEPFINITNLEYVSILQ